METNFHVEMDNEGRPLVSVIDLIASKYLIYVITFLIYLGLHILAITYDKTFMESPLLKYTGMAMGAVGAFVSYLPAIIVLGVVFGQFEFASSVLKIYKISDFQIAMALIIFTIPVVRILARILERATHAYKFKRVLFFVLPFFIPPLAVHFCSIFERLRRTDLVYLFCFFIIGICFFLLTCRGAKQNT